MFHTGAVRYWSLTLAGLLLAGASIVVINWGLYELIRTGTCASGGPYVSANPCPPGTAGRFFATFGGFFMGLVGLGLWAGRGGRGRHSPIGLGMVMWALLFCTIAASAAVAAFGPAHSADNDGAKLAAIILGAVFVPMGLAPLPFAVVGNMWRPGGRRVADLMARGELPQPVIARPPAPPPNPAPQYPATWKPAFSARDPVERLEQLSDMRSKGLITPAEFEEAKRRVLGGL